MTNLPPLDDHAFWALVKARLQDFSKSLPQIADELGVDCHDLTHAWLAYKPPQQMPKASVNTFHGGRGNRDSAGSYLKAQRFRAWRQGRDGAAEARRAMEEQGR